MSEIYVIFRLRAKINLLKKLKRLKEPRIKGWILRLYIEMKKPMRLKEVKVVALLIAKKIILHAEVEHIGIGVAEDHKDIKDLCH